MSVGDPKREIARCEHFDIGVDDRFGRMCLHGNFAYGESGGTGQGFGWVIDADFVVSLCEAFNVDRVSKISGRACWVTHTWDTILKIEPLFAKDGKPFDIEAWRTSRKKTP